MKIMKTSLIALLFVFAASAASADPLTCDLGGYKATDGLTAAVSDNTLTVTWAGGRLVAAQVTRQRIGGGRRSGEHEQQRGQ